MSVRIAVSGTAAEAVDRVVPQLVSDLVASRITGGDATLWGPEAESEASIRLGWVEAVAVSRPLVDDIIALRDRLRDSGIHRIVLCGMGGSSLAPEVITRTYGVDLVVLDSTDPGQVADAIGHRLDETAVVVSSKSGSTVETDSQKRAFERAFRDAGLDPVERIIVVTDPGSPLDTAARESGYRVFNADPNVGGRYSALTAFGLVPSGLAGADLDELLDEAEAMSLELAVDSRSNPGLVLGAAIAGTRPLRDKLAIVSDGTHVVGFGDWAEQLIAESTGKQGTGILPVVIGPEAPELREDLPDLQVVRIVADWDETRHVEEGEIEITGTLGALLLTWEYAVAVAGRLLGINPFDQPDVESAKVAARALIDNPIEESAPAFESDGIAVRGSGSVLEGVTDLDGALSALLSHLDDHGYVAVHAYLDRERLTRFAELRDAVAARAKRPVTFGWGPRFLHSTGQYHKGGPANGVFLQLTSRTDQDLAVPDRPFTFGRLIRAQADGDASVLERAGRPVLGLELADPEAALPRLLDALGG